MSSAVTFGSFLTMNALTASPDLASGDADHGAFQHAGMARDHFLDLVRIDVEARHQDHVLLAIDDLGVAVRAHHADVAGAEIAVRGHHIGGLVRPVPVAGHHLRALGADFAGLAERHLVAVVVADREPGRGHGNADRAGELVGIGGVAGQRRRGFRQAVAFRQRAAGDLQPFFGNRLSGSPCRRRTRSSAWRNRACRSRACSTGRCRAC